MLAVWEVGSKKVVHVSGGQRCCCALWRQHVDLSCRFGNLLSSSLHDFGGEARAGHSWMLPGASATFHSGGGVMVPFKRKQKIVSLSFVISLGGSLSDKEGLRDTYFIPESKR